MPEEPLSLEEQLKELLGIEPEGEVAKFSYDDFLEYFRRVPAGKMMRAKDWLNENLPVEGFAAASRWMEIIGNPTRMDKLYQGRLKAQEKDSIKDLAVGDDDEAFYEALILENVAKLDESRNSAQEVARITQNLNIFRKQLRDIRSRKPKKGSVLQQVLEAAAKPPPAPKKQTETKKKKGKKSGTRKTQTNGSRKKKSEVPKAVPEDSGEQGEKPKQAEKEK